MKTLSPNTLVGRLGSGLPGPAQAIPFADFSGEIGRVNVKSELFGAVGDGSTDDTAAIQAAIDSTFPANSNSLNPTNQGQLYFPPGNYKISSALTLTNVVGAIIYGDGGAGTSQITQATPGQAVFYCNGISYSVIEQLQFNVAASGVGVDLDWDNVQPVNSQEVTIYKCFFNGSNNGDIGLRLGNSGFQVSENTIRDCYFTNHAVAAIKVCNANALGNQLYGGNIIGCGQYGVWINGGGAIENITGVDFENGNSNTWDIYINASAGDGYLVSGCRTESANFLNAPRGLVTIVGCLQSNNGSSNVTFAQTGAHPMTLMGCCSGAGAGTGGIIAAHNNQPAVAIGCEFGQPFSAMTGTIYAINSWFNGVQDVGGGTLYQNVSPTWNAGTGAANTGNGLLEVIGNGNSSNGEDIISIGNNSAVLGALQLKTRGTTPTSQVIVQNNDDVGQFKAQGSDGSAYRDLAGFRMSVDGSPGSGSMPGRLVLETTPSGGTTVVERMRIDNAGNVLINTGAIATNATNGFLYIPTCAGVPTGTPTSYSGLAPMVYDTTDNKLYVYNGAWKGVVLS